MSPAETQIGTVRECEHVQVRHQHGHHTTYKRDRCGCDPCTAAYRRWRKARVLARDRGERALVDAGRAREHVAALLAAGVTVGQVQNRSGVNRSTIRTLLGVFPNRPALVQLHRTTADRLLAVTSERVGSERHGLVDQTGTARRLQALIAVGWTQKQLADALGRRIQDFRIVVLGERPVYVSTRLAVADLYDRWWDQQPPQTTTFEKRAASYARGYARRNGWAPPLAWDDDTIDDPTAQPVGMRPDLRDAAASTRGPLPSVDPLEVEDLLDLGEPPAAIARQLGVKPASLQTLLERAGRRDLWLRLSAADQKRRDPTTRKAAA